MQARLDTAQVRRLLEELLPSDADFEAFCLDYFSKVHARFSGSMDRVRKTNILLEQIKPQLLVDKLRESQPDAPVWSELAERGGGVISVEDSPARDRSKLLYFLVPGALGLALLSGLYFHYKQTQSVAPKACPSLQIDDVIVEKPSEPPRVVLDVRLRSDGTQVIDVTRADVQILKQNDERGAYAPSAEYDVQIKAEHNEFAVAHRLASGELDRLLIKLGFPAGIQARSYQAQLNLRYNGHCEQHSQPFDFSTPR